MLEPLIESQRQLGPLLVCPSPEINPTIQNRNGVDMPLVKPLRFEESDCLSDQSQMNVLSTSVSVCTLPLQLPNQSASSEETGDDNFVGSSSLEPMEIVLQEAFEPEAVHGIHHHAPAVTVLKEEIGSQLALEMIDECETHYQCKTSSR